MKILKFKPIYPLSNYILHMIHVQGYAPISCIRELPDGGINLVIELVENTQHTVYKETGVNDKYRIKDAWITGAQDSAILYDNDKKSSILSIRFTTGGFFALTGIPITEIEHVVIPAELVLGNSFKVVYEQLLDSNSTLGTFQLLEKYFLQFNREESFENSVVKFLDRNIDRPIDWLVYRSGYSQKHFIHLTKQYTGFTPKYLQRLNRFQKSIKAIQSQKDQIDWASITYGLDYYDQAHFIKEFSHFSGLKPSKYGKSQLIDNDENHVISDMVLEPLIH